MNETKIAQEATPEEPDGILRPVAAYEIDNISQSKQGGDMKKKPRLKVVGIILVILLGIGSGFGLSQVTNGSGKVSLNSFTSLTQDKNLQREVGAGDIKPGVKIGIADESTFKDMAEGNLEKGGIDGEGSHHLIRPGGESQTIYLTSSVIDLDQLVGMTVRVWGETFNAQKAGWLMDVGKLEVLEKQAIEE